MILSSLVTCYCKIFAKLVGEIFSIIKSAYTILMRFHINEHLNCSHIMPVRKFKYKKKFFYPLPANCGVDQKRGESIFP